MTWLNFTPPVPLDKEIAFLLVLMLGTETSSEVTCSLDDNNIPIATTSCLCSSDMAHDVLQIMTEYPDSKCSYHSVSL